MRFMMMEVAKGGARMMLTRENFCHGSSIVCDPNLWNRLTAPGIRLRKRIPNMEKCTVKSRRAPER